VINLDETNFGVFKSGRPKSARSNCFRKKIVREEVPESHFVAALVVMILTEDALSPGFIMRRSTDHPDASRVSYYEYVVRYSSEKAFVTRSISGDYMCVIDLPLIQIMWTERRNPESRAILIFDGHQSHMSQVISALAAEHGIAFSFSHYTAVTSCGPLIRDSFPASRSYLDNFSGFENSRKRSRRATAFSWCYNPHSSRELFGILVIMPALFQ
jgi:hypothetical protein